VKFFSIFSQLVMLTKTVQPIPLDLLTLVNFTDPPTQRGAGLLRNLRGGERHNTTDPSGVATKSPEATDSRSVYPCTIHHNGRMGGPYILYAESAQVRAEWKVKLDEALGLRKAVQDNNKVFEVETLSNDTFLVPSLINNGGNATPPAWNHENSFTGKVTCTVPLSE
jgi:RHO1 GDP-GTP exchange protein 1/2